MDESGTTCGTAVAGSIFGTLLCIAILAIGAWWFYKKCWKNKSDSQLVVDDEENVKVDYAFDNPAFKGDNNKNSSPFDNKWKTSDKRKTVDDSFANSPIPRLVPLRGSDFTGLGIEVCGGLKDGIYVKKVMPQGPAANIVNRGDKITSMTIDFRHIVQEDAATILSFASPYNVQLELIDGKGTLPTTMQQQMNQQTSLTHPLYRSSSQEDFNTIERNARKKLFLGDENSYPTLKMDQQATKPRSPNARLPIAHEEHEKNNSLKKFQHFIDMVEEKFQTKYSSSSSPPRNEQQQHQRDDNKKSGMKFGIRVLPPCIGDKEIPSTSIPKSPSKAQADNENNTNMERIDVENGNISMMVNVSSLSTSSQPEATKRTKHNKSEIMVAKPIDEVKIEFERQSSINSSGIKRDAAGIPQEIPSEMMQAALTARDNRKATGTAERKAKGKAPCPPSNITTESDQSSDVAEMSISSDMPDATNAQIQLNRISMVDKLNFTENFIDNGLDKNQINSIAIDVDSKELSNCSTPKSGRVNDASDTESQMVQDHDSDTEMNAFSGINTKQIELNSKHITVHQTSEEDDSEERRTSSLCDLSKLAYKIRSNGNQSNNGTLERAQSLEMSDAISQSTKITPKKRKITLDDQAEECELKEPRLSESIIETLEPLQKGRLKSAYEWGNLEDAIYDGIVKEKGNTSDTESIELSASELAKQAMVNVQTDIMAEVLAAADKFDCEVNDIELNQVINEAVIKSKDDNTIMNGIEITCKPITINKQTIDDTTNFIEAEIENSNYIVNTITANNKNDMDVQTFLNGSNVTVTNNKDENELDDIKVSRYSFESIDRPKSEVLKKLIAQNNPNGMDELNEIIPNGISNEKPKIIETITAATKITTTKTLIGTPTPMNTETPTTNITKKNNIQTNEITMNSYIADDAVSGLTGSSQMSPVFSSDGQGINNVCITSIESNEQPTINGEQTQSTNDENSITTILTDEYSQPSSIILIDDEKINFTLRTVDDSDGVDDGDGDNDDDDGNDDEPGTITEHFPQTHSIKDEVIIIESLSSKKTNDSTQLPLANQKIFFTNEHDIEPMTNNDSFVTEISLSNAKEMDQKMNAKNLIKTFTDKPNDKPTTNLTMIKSTTSISSTAPSNGTNDKQIIVEEEYIPRNTEIKFTTSTYQSPHRQFEKRHSHIDQIRSNFERQHTSEIPVPIRKLSTSSTPPPPLSTSSSTSSRTSPSKIPVFNSQKSSDNLKNHGTNRVSVSVTSIKNSSRNPSGK